MSGLMICCFSHLSIMCLSAVSMQLHWIRCQPVYVASVFSFLLLASIVVIFSLCCWLRMRGTLRLLYLLNGDFSSSQTIFF